MAERRAEMKELEAKVNGLKANTERLIAQFDDMSQRLEYVCMSDD
jgi:hypothetical protein